MGANTAIAWCDHTFNHVIGCSKVHEGCAHCYAEADMDKRRGRVTWGPQGTRSKTSADYWRHPLKWNREAEKAGERRRVFCASLADVFEDWKGPIRDHLKRRLWIERGGMGTSIMPESAGYSFANMRPLTMDDLRVELFRLIDATPRLDWLLLTKRPENIAKMWHLGGIPNPGPCDKSPEETAKEWASRLVRTQLVRKNVWLGTSVSLQEHADKQITELVKCRDLALGLFVSYEPALGPIDFSQWLGIEHDRDGSWRYKSDLPIEPQLDQIIVGGESSHGSAEARPFDLEWARDTIRQCHAAQVACFIKQLGSRPFSTEQNELRRWPKGTGYFMGDAETISFDDLESKAGADPREWADDLRVQEFPKVAA